MKVLARDLAFPEGPVVTSEGDILFVEIMSGGIRRLRDGQIRTVATPGGGPNGMAFGPDGALYVCNNGGFRWHRDKYGVRPAGTPDDYSGGRIERVDPATGKVTLLYDTVAGERLKGPNDIVFDRSGGFWFTDHGKIYEDRLDMGAVYYAESDGSGIRKVIPNLLTPNGIGLSPAEDTLYVAETRTGRLWSFDIEARGTVRTLDVPVGPGGRLVAGLPGFQNLDSLAVDSMGNICVATLGRGGITVVSPLDATTRFVAMPDRFTTNICFGGPDMSEAYITLSSTGRIVKMDWPVPGLRLNFQS